MALTCLLTLMIFVLLELLCFVPQQNSGWRLPLLNAHHVQATSTVDSRCELLGAFMSLLILRWASSTLLSPLKTAVFHCDNKWVISHSNSLLISLPEKQWQADLIQHIKYLSFSLQLKVTWEWVECHAVQHKDWVLCTGAECFNDQADLLAKMALQNAISCKIAYEGDFTFEMLSLKIGGQLVCGSLCHTLQGHWGYSVAKALFVKKKIIQQENFFLVWWEGVTAAMSLYPKMYHAWLTQHVSEFCGNNVLQYYWSKGTHSPKCNFCADHDEYTTHICQCHDPGQVKMFQITVQEVSNWIMRTLWHTDISLLGRSYCLGRGLIMMESCVDCNNEALLTVAQGGTALSKREYQAYGYLQLLPSSPYLVHGYQMHHGEKSSLSNFEQWIYRNSLLYYWGQDSLTISEHHNSSNRIEEYLYKPWIYTSLTLGHRFLGPQDQPNVLSITVACKYGHSAGSNKIGCRRKSHRRTTRTFFQDTVWLSRVMIFCHLLGQIQILLVQLDQSPAGLKCCHRLLPVMTILQYAAALTLQDWKRKTKAMSAYLSHHIV